MDTHGAHRHGSRRQEAYDYSHVGCVLLKDEARDEHVSNAHAELVMDTFALRDEHAMLVLTIGGALFEVHSGATLRMLRVHLTNGSPGLRTATCRSSEGGGAIRACVGANVILEDLSITDCYSPVGGGGVLSYGHAVLRNVRLARLATGGRGGGINSGSGPGSSLLVNDSVIEACTAEFGGAAVLSSPWARFSNTSFDSCLAHTFMTGYPEREPVQRGGAIFVEGEDVELVLDRGSRLSNCSASKDGGAINIENQGGSYRHILRLISVTLEGCHAGGEGGGVAASGAEIVMVNARLNGCWARQAGGGVMLVAAAQRSQMDVRDSSILDCSCTDGDGGALFIESGLVDVTDSEVIGCRAERFGGGFASSGTLTITRALLSDCKAGTAGGALDVAGDGTLHLGRVNIFHCAGLWHGASIRTSTEIRVALVNITHECSLQNNYGAIHLTGGSTSLRGLQVSLIGQCPRAVTTEGSAKALVECSVDTCGFDAECTPGAPLVLNSNESAETSMTCACLPLGYAVSRLPELSLHFES